MTKIHKERVEEVVEEFMKLHVDTQGKWRIERHTAKDFLRTYIAATEKRTARTRR